MAKVSHTNSRRMYSWWWDSHISPKNSKWLQENLTDMDAKVKSMIKLLEEDADSFARRAEMYYKKRPELMKIVEEFYRAYRALAERYDHATGVIRHAHRTMSEAFPNQVPSMFGDDSPVGSVSGTDPRTPEISTSIGESIDESESVNNRKARRELNFDDEAADKEYGTLNNRSDRDRNLSSSKSNQESEEIQKLKEALTKLEAEKEAGLVQYQRSLDKISQLQAEVSKMSEDYKVLRDHANEADNEAAVLKEAIMNLEAEKESKLQDYQQCVDKISNLQGIISTAQEESQKLSERASTAENEVLSLKGEMEKLVSEKDEALNKYMQSLETISNLENKLHLTDEDAQRLKGRAEKAESEVEVLRQTIAKLTEEKDAAALQYHCCLETISSLEEKLTTAQEEAKRLNEEVDSGATKLKSAEEQCLLLERSNQSLHSELESLMLKMGSQTEELTEKQKELGRLWACIQEERLRFVEAETAFQTLQHLRAQTQEELRGVASELQNRTQILQVMETQNHGLQDEVLKVKEENKRLDEMNASSALSMKDMQSEISSLIESKGKLQEEVEVRLDERNALQQEMYCLKEELNDVTKKQRAILDQVHVVGLNPDSLESSVKKLQEENSSLKDTCQRESAEKAALLVKLEQLLEKNSLLETSLSDLNAELEAVRGKLAALEQSYDSLLREKSAVDDEKASLTAHLHETKKNLEKLSEHNTVLENFIATAHEQLEALKAKSKALEDSCQLLVDEKAGLISANDVLTAQLENTSLRLADLGKLYGELEGRCVTLEKENETTLRKAEELQKSLEVERQEHVNYVQMSETKIRGIEKEMGLLNEESECRKKELDQMLDNAIVNEIEIFVLQVTAQEIKENNRSLSIKNQKLLDECSMSEKKISQLEQKSLQGHVEIKSLSDQTGRLRAGAYKLLKVFDIVDDCRNEVTYSEQDQIYLDLLLTKLQQLKLSLNKAEEENLELTTELSVLIAWLKHLQLDTQNLKLEKNQVDTDLKVRTEQVLVLQSEALTLHEMNEELKSKVRDGECNKEALMTEVEGLNKKLMDMQGACQILQGEKLKIIKEKESLMCNILQLEEKNSSLEEENYGLCDKVLALESLSLIFRTFADEKSVVFKELGDDRNKLHDMNTALMGKLSLTEGSLVESKTENHLLKERLEKAQDEMKAVATVKDQLTVEIENGKKQVAELVLEIQRVETKLSSVEQEKRGLNESVEESTTENHQLKEKLQKAQDELAAVATVRDQLAMEIENRKKQVDEMTLELQNAKEKINLIESERLELNESVEESKTLYCHLMERLQETQDELMAIAAVKDQLSLEIENGNKRATEMAMEHQKAEEKINSVEKEKLELVENLKESKTENHHLKETLQKAEEEWTAIASFKDRLAMDIENEKKLMAGMTLELQKAEEKIDLLEKEKLALNENVEKSNTENQHLKERLQKEQDDLTAVATVKEQLVVQIEDEKKQLAVMTLGLKKAEEKIISVEKEKMELNESMEDLRNKYGEVKQVCGQQDNQILKLSADNDNLSRDENLLREAFQKLEFELQELHDEHEKRKMQEENLHCELQKKITEIDELETQAATVFGQLQNSMVSQLLYVHKFHEVRKECLVYVEQSEDLKTQLAACGLEVASLRECISSLENHTDIHIKLQNPENEELQGSQSTRGEEILSEDNKASKPSTVSDLRNLRKRLQAIEKAAVEMKELMIQENISLHAKLDSSTRQFELLQAESGRYRRSTRPTSEITEADNALLTKDIMLDHISDGSSNHLSKKEPVDQDNQIVELWETGDRDGTVGLTVRKSRKTVSPSDRTESLRIRTSRKQKGIPTSDSIDDDFSVEKLENSKRSTDSEGNRRKVLERLDSDVQKLANLQITVQDLKRKLDVTEKGKRGKAVIECESLKSQLEEADVAIIKLFDLNARLMKNIDDRSFSDPKSSSSFDQGDATNADARRRKVSEQARRMSEKIGRLQLEVQKLQFVLLKLDDEKESRSKLSEARRRTLLRDYLYGGRTGQRRKKGHFCSCVQPSTTE